MVRNIISQKPMMESRYTVSPSLVHIALNVMCSSQTFKLTSKSDKIREVGHLSRPEWMEPWRPCF